MFLRRIAWFVLLLGCSLAARGAPPEGAGEYQIKGGYLYNFANFVEWPNGAFPDSEAPFVIAILDRDDAAGVIMKVLTGKHTANGRRIRVVRASGYDRIPRDCQVLFISRTVPAEWSEIRARIGVRPVLLVGETDGFAQHGGAINFVVSGDQVRMEINQRRAAGAGLRLSGSLASVARLVRDKEAP